MNDGGADSINFSDVSRIAERQGFGPILGTIVTDLAFRQLIQADTGRSELLTRLATAMRRAVAAGTEAA